MLILCLPICHTILKRECMCETMNPGPFLIIRNTFPIIFKHILHSAILKSENTKTHLLLAFIYKNPQKYHPSSLLSSLHHYSSPLHFYLLFCIYYCNTLDFGPFEFFPKRKFSGYLKYRWFYPQGMTRGFISNSRGISSVGFIFLSFSRFPANK